ncbi:hypothetical protein SUGI_0112940 [Cryptomeria japonica]|nr:hypothetical protein SUGI_0112940 [Cryptomeria japonica]
MAHVVVGKGLWQSFGEGIMQDGVEAEYCPFILGNDGGDREPQTEEDRVGWQALKDYVREREVELHLAREAKKRDMTIG